MDDLMKSFENHPTVQENLASWHKILVTRLANANDRPTEDGGRSRPFLPSMCKSSKTIQWLIVTWVQEGGAESTSTKGNKTQTGNTVQ